MESKKGQKVLVVVKAGRDKDKPVLELASGDMFSKLHVPTRSSPSHRVGEIWNGIVEYDNQPDNPRKGVAFVYLESLLESVAQWNWYAWDEREPWFVGWEYKLPGGRTMRDDSGKPGLVKAPADVLNAWKTARAEHLVKLAEAEKSGELRWLENGSYGSHPRLGIQVSSTSRDIWKPTSKDALTAEEIAQLQQFETRGITIKPSAGVVSVKATNTEVSFKVATDLFKIVSSWGVVEREHYGIYLEREEEFLPTAEIVKRSHAISRANPLVSVSNESGHKGLAVELPNFPDDCPTDIKAQAYDLYKARVFQRLAEKKEKKTEEINKFFQTLIEMLASILVQGMAAVQSQYRSGGSSGRRGDYYSWDASTSHHLFFLDGRSIQLDHHGFGVEKFTVAGIGRALWQKIRECQEKAEFWDMELPEPLTAETIKKIKAIQDLKRRVLAAHAVITPLEEKVDWRHRSNLPGDVQSPSLRSAAESPDQANWWTERERLETELVKAHRYVDYLRCRAAGEPWGEAEQAEALRQATQKALDDMIAAEAQAREAKRAGAVLQVIRPQLARFGVEAPTYFALKYLEREGGAPVSQDAPPYLDNQFPVLARETWEGGVRNVEAMTLARVPFEGKALELLYFYKYGRHNLHVRLREVAETTPPASEAETADEPTPAAVKESSKFEDIGDYNFRCPCGRSLRLTKTDRRIYNAGEEVSVRCDCSRSGTVKK